MRKKREQLNKYLIDTEEQVQNMNLQHNLKIQFSVGEVFFSSDFGFNALPFLISFVFNFLPGLFFFFLQHR